MEAWRQPSQTKNDLFTTERFNIVEVSEGNKFYCYYYINIRKVHHSALSQRAGQFSTHSLYFHAQQ